MAKFIFWHQFEYEDHGLRFSQVEVSQKLISMEDIEK